MEIIVRAEKENILIYCPFKWCGGWIKVEVEKLLKEGVVVAQCRGGKKGNHEVVVKLRGVPYLKIEVR